jgi:hypothetical protein
MSLLWCSFLMIFMRQYINRINQQVSRILISICWKKLTNHENCNSISHCRPHVVSFSKYGSGLWKPNMDLYLWISERRREISWTNYFSLFTSWMSWNLYYLGNSLIIQIHFPSARCLVQDSLLSLQILL